MYNPADTSCVTPVLQLSGTGQCAQINPVVGKLRVGSTIMGDGACAVSGGESRGSVTGDKPLSVYCDR